MCCNMLSAYTCYYFLLITNYPDTHILCNSSNKKNIEYVTSGKYISQHCDLSLNMNLYYKEEMELKLLYFVNCVH